MRKICETRLAVLLAEIQATLKLDPRCASWWACIWEQISIPLWEGNPARAGSTSGAFGPVAVTAGSRLSFWLDAAASPGASTYTVTLRNVTASLNLASVTTSGGTAAGIFTAALANIPSADSTLELQVSRTGAGPHAVMKDAILLLST